MKKNILINLCILVGMQLSAQTLTVKDKISLQPLDGVKINNRETDQNGRLNLASIQVSPAHPVYVFSKPGYYSDSLSAGELKALQYTVLLTERSQDWGNVVVSASRFEEKSTDVAQQNLVLSKREMQFMNQPTTAELLQQSGRAFVQKSQMGGGSIVMRGFEANKVLMVVDGVRMNNAIYRGGHLQNVLSVDNSMLERTEMLFGPGSVIYGSDALGGVLHFFTKTPMLSGSDKPLFKAMAFTRVGTAMDEKSAHFDINLGYRRFAFLSSATLSDFGDSRIGRVPAKGYESWGRSRFTVQRFDGRDSMVTRGDSFRQSPTAYRQWDLLQKVLFRQNSYITHLLNLQHSNTGNVPRYDRLSELSDRGLPVHAEWYYGPQTRSMASYKMAVEYAHALFEKANIILAFQDIRESRHNRGFQSATRSNRYEKVKVWSLNADLEKQVSEKTELRYGIELTHNDVASRAEKVNLQSADVSPQSTRYPDGGSVMKTAALYLTQNTYFSEHLILNAGLRFTATGLHSVFNDKTFFPFLAGSIRQNHQNSSGNIGLVYLLKDNLKVAATLASGFRSPNVDDMAKVFESTGGRIIIPNAQLKPEQTTNFDLTVNKSLRKKLNLELNGYYTEFSNALTLGRATLNGQDTLRFDGVSSAVYTTQNALEAYLFGGFAGFSYDPFRYLGVSGSISYTRGRIRTDSSEYPLDHISPVYGRLGVVYKHRKYKAEFFTLFNGAKRSADYNLMGEDNHVYSADPLRGYTPAWYTLNLRAQYQLNKTLQLQFALENLLDRHYRTFSSGYSAPGRNFVLTLRGNF